MATSRTTQDHEEIRRWAEERGAVPSHVIDTGSTQDIGVLRLDFPGYTGADRLEPISWEQFFEKFDERNLALVYQEETAEGQKSNFNKIISAESAEEVERGRSKRPSRATSRKPASGASSGKKAQKAASATRGGSATSAKKTAPAKKKSAVLAKKTAANRASTTAKKGKPAKKSASRTSRKSAAKSTAKRSSSSALAASRRSTKKAASKKSGRRR